MEAVAKAAPQQRQMKLNEVMVSGRINNLTTFEASGKRVHEARIAIAAPDQYSMPGAVLVQSSYKLGNQGDDVTVHCTVGGFPDSWKDKNTGEVKQTARIVLRVIE